MHQTHSLLFKVAPHIQFLCLPDTRPRLTFSHLLTESAMKREKSNLKNRTLLVSFLFIGISAMRERECYSSCAAHRSTGIIITFTNDVENIISFAPSIDTKFHSYKWARGARIDKISVWLLISGYCHGRGDWVDRVIWRRDCHTTRTGLAKTKIDF